MATGLIFINCHLPSFSARSCSSKLVNSLEVITGSLVLSAMLAVIFAPVAVLTLMYVRGVAVP